MQRILFCLTLLTSACFLTNALQAKEIPLPSGKVLKETRAVSSFKNIIIAGSGQLYIKQGNQESLVIEAEDKVLPEINSEVKDDTLTLSPKESGFSIFSINQPVIYHLTVKNIENINISGDMHISGRNTLTTNQLNLEISGAGTADLKVKVESLKTKISGSSDIIVQGSANQQIIEIEGAGEFNGKKLNTKKTRVSISGAGNTIVNASEELDINISGFGKVQYYGQPKITQEISGGGEIIPLG